MNTLFDLINPFFAIIMLLASGQAMTSVILLLYNRKKQYSNSMLALWCGIWGTSCFFFFAFIQGAPVFSRPLMAFIGPLVPISLFPPLYLYVKHLFYEQKAFTKGDFIHFIPVLVTILFSIYIYLDSGADTELMRKHALYHFRSLATSYIAAIQGLFYFIWIRKILTKQEQKLKNEYSDIEEMKLSWVHVINNLSLPVMIIGTLSAVVKSTPFDPYLLFIAYHLCMAFCLYYISFQLVLHPISLTGKKMEYSVDNVFVIASQKEELKIVTEEQTPVYEQIIKELQELMEKKQCFRDQDICLQDLAEELSISRNQLSYALNHHLNTSFYDYINELRVKDVKQRMQNPKYAHYSILAIALDSGFKSKTVFYRFFKQVEGITPSEYRSSLK
ncbi:MAG: helix-turn-helix domain-containing protein [Bacteroidales bacterium]